MAAFYADPPQAPYWPSQHWHTSTPEAQGMDSAKLAGVLEFVRTTDLPLHSVTVIRHGALVLDASFYPYGAGMLHNVASVTKSVTSALIGIAIDKGHIRSVTQPMLDFFPGWTVPNLDATQQAITVEHLLTMTSGLDCGFTPTEAELFAMLRSQHWVEFTLGLPMKLAPGTRFAYCSPGVHLLAGIIRATAGESPADFARRHLFEPLGIQETVWPADPQGVNFGFGGLRLHPHDMARRIAGKTYRLEENPFGWLSVALRFAMGEGWITMDQKTGPWGPLAVGLDNVYRLAPGRFDIPMAVRGSWQAQDTFVLELNEVGNIDAWRFTFTFRDDRVTLTGEEMTGQHGVTVEGQDVG